MINYSKIMEENGKVIELIEAGAKVEVIPNPICGACAAADACAAIGSKAKIIVAVNPINAQVGDLVKLETKEKSRTVSILLVFGLPVILLLTGIIIGATIAGDKFAVFLGGGGLILAFVLVKIIDHWLGKKKTFLPMIIEKITDATANKSCPKS